MNVVCEKYKMFHSNENNILKFFKFVITFLTSAVIMKWKLTNSCVLASLAISTEL